MKTRAFHPVCCNMATKHWLKPLFFNGLLRKHSIMAGLMETVGTMRKNIEAARQISPLAASAVTLLAASKGQSGSVIGEALASGIRHFGENKVQEAQHKWPELKKSVAGVILHLIGPLQSNKVKEALALFDVIQTIDRMKLAEAIAKERPSPHHQFYIQVNTGKEPQKAGVMPGEADALIDHCRSYLHLNIVGLMCIPPHDQLPAPHFAWLRELGLRHGLKECSMGMSGDYETAVRMGSSCVRIGTALFGERA